MRIVKEHEVRKKEILDTAETLFITKGYDKTTINDILNAIGIAKGTFYHYFKSKEQVMDAIIKRVVDRDTSFANSIVSDKTIDPVEKIFKVLIGQKSFEADNKKAMVQEFQKPENAQIHQRSMVQSIRNLAPVLTQAVEEGIEAGIFHTDYPSEVMEFLLSSGQIMFDDGLFGWTEEELSQKAKAFVYIMEKVLEAEKGTFEGISKVLIKE